MPDDTDLTASVEKLFGPAHPHRRVVAQGDAVHLLQFQEVMRQQMDALVAELDRLKAEVEALRHGR